MRPSSVVASKAPVSHGEILRLALPNILSNLAVPFLGAADSFLMGRFVGVQALGAVSIGASLFSFLTWAFGFLRMGTTGLVAQSYGAGAKDEIDEHLSRALAFAWIAGGLLFLTRGSIASVFLPWFEASPEVAPLAEAYVQVRLLAAPFTLSLFCLHGFFLGIQNARVPLILTLVGQGINLAASWYLVAYRQGGAQGVALGTVASQVLVFFLAWAFYRRERGRWFPQPRGGRLFQAQAWGRLFRLHGDLFVRTVLLLGALSYFTRESARGGDAMLAANSILLHLWNFHAYFVDGFAFAAESLVGKLVGLQEEDLWSRVVRRLSLWCLVLTGLFGLGAWGRADWFLLAFGSTPEVLELAQGFLPWLLASLPINALAFLLDGIAIGATASRALRTSMILSALGVYLPSYALLGLAGLPPGGHRLWAALFCFQLARLGTLTYWFFRRGAGTISREGETDRGRGAPTFDT